MMFSTLIVLADFADFRRFFIERYSFYGIIIANFDKYKLPNT